VVKIEPFIYQNDKFGGTENMARGWHKNVKSDASKFNNYNSIIAPGVVPDIQDLYKSDKEIIFWLHNNPDQFGVFGARFFSDYRFIEKLKYIIVPSEYAKQQVIKKTKITSEKVYVIPNAINSLNYKEHKFKNVDKIKLINTSSPDRGIELLLNAMKLDMLDFDYEIDIFSNFNPTKYEGYEPTSNINFYGFSYKNTVIKHYENAHIHAYPSTYLETFCLSQAEAMSAGLLCVTSDLGAIPEISNGYTSMFEFSNDSEKNIKMFSDKLNESAAIIKSGRWNPEEQIEFINKTYSWQAIKEKWLEFHELL
jgi:glycosyltransferase involved in cell wall biosynthesis